MSKYSNSEQQRGEQSHISDYEDKEGGGRHIPARFIPLRHCTKEARATMS